MGQGLLDNVFAGENGLGNVLPKLFGGLTDSDGKSRQAKICYVTWRTYDKKTMTETGNGVTEYTCDMTPPTGMLKELIDGKEVRTDHFMTVIPSFQTPEEPPSRASLEYAGRRYTIVKVWSIVSGSEVCNYRLALESV